ncbi:MAG TPA: hypothetical protein VFX63_10315 [Pyrinomonadaceae bacterium]|nr:hypothetical protein [Pyrinomonadaceae bacterium]
MSKRLLVAASLLIFSIPSLVSACTCTVGGGKCDRSWNYGKVIFAGTVTRELLSTERFTRVFQLSVSESFRGPAIAGQDIPIYTGNGGGDCGYRFEIGTSYLVYADLEGDRLFTSICSHTGTAAQTAHIIRQLRASQKGERVADLFGLVRRFQYPFGVEPLEVEALDARRVRVIGGKNFELSTTTDQEGVFSFPTLPAGTYRIEVDPPPSGMSQWHLNRGEPVEIEATGGSGCSTNLSFIAASMIKGQVVDDYGQSIAGVVSLESADEKEAEAAKRTGGLISSKTDTGEFQLWLATPGRYRLVYRPKAGHAPPVSSDVIKVNLGEWITNFRFKVPSVRP